MEYPVARLVYFEGPIMKEKKDFKAWSEIGSYEDVLETASELSKLEKSSIKLYSGPILISKNIYGDMLKAAQSRRSGDATFVLGLSITQ